MPPPPPPPAPPPGPAPPAAMSVSKKDKQGGGRTVLLGDIKKGVKLKSSKHLMNDRSEPTVVGKNGGNDKFKTLSGPKDHSNRKRRDLENGFATVSSPGVNSRNMPNLGDIFAGGIPKLRSAANGIQTTENNYEKNPIDPTKNMKKEMGRDSSMVFHDLPKHLLHDDTASAAAAVNVEKKKPPVPSNKPSFQMTAVRPFSATSISVLRPGLKLPPPPPLKPSVYRSNNCGDVKSSGRPVSCVPMFKPNDLHHNNSEPSSSSSQRSPRPLSVFESTNAVSFASSSSPRTPRPLSALESNGNSFPSSSFSSELIGNDEEITNPENTKTAMAARALNHNYTSSSLTTNPNNKIANPSSSSSSDSPPEIPKRERRIGTNQRPMLSTSSLRSSSNSLHLPSTRFSSSVDENRSTSNTIDLKDYSLDSSVVKRGTSYDSEFEAQFHFRSEKEFPDPDLFKRSHKIYPSKIPKNPVFIRKSFVSPQTKA